MSAEHERIQREKKVDMVGAWEQNGWYNNYHCSYQTTFGVGSDKPIFSL